MFSTQVHNMALFSLTFLFARPISTAMLKTTKSLSYYIRIALDLFEIYTAKKSLFGTYTLNSMLASKSQQ